MEFSYDAYRALLRRIQAQGYAFADYGNYEAFPRSLIMRHDIDYCLDYAVDMAEIEGEEGVRAFFFIETTSEFYNILAKSEKRKLRRILSLGHAIGLHFDRTQYGDDFSCFSPGYAETVQREARLLSEVVERPVTAFSLHEPLAAEIEADFAVEGLVNVYRKTFFQGFKYYSDSMMRWREDILAGLAEAKYPRIQVLVHPFWYAPAQGDVKRLLLRFIRAGNLDRYEKTKLICGYLDEYVTPEEALSAGHMGEGDH